MDWNFSFGWLILGIMIAGAGTFIVGKYQMISDNFMSGPSSYDKCKLFGFVLIGVGLLVAANLHTLVLSLFVQVVFKRGG